MNGREIIASILASAVVLSIVLLLSWQIGLKKSYWDHEVQKLCESSSPLVTIYEQVPSGTTDLEQARFIKNRVSDSGATEYRAHTERKIIHESNPLVEGITTTYSRNQTQKLLAAGKSFLRSGGDFPMTTDNKSQFSCVNVKTVADQYQKRVFIQGAVENDLTAN